MKHENQKHTSADFNSSVSLHFDTNEMQRLRTMTQQCLYNTVLPSQQFESASIVMGMMCK